MAGEGGRRKDVPTSYGLHPPQRQPTVRDSRLPPQSGRVVGSRYRLIERLGHGGMGTVWKAHDPVVDRDVAVKEPRLPHHLGERERRAAYERMHREARAAAGIDHPSVVTVHDVVVEDGRPWMVMELVRGRSLADLLDEGVLPPREAARIVLQVLRALAAAHDRGVLHRDVKPGNVLLAPYDRVVLTDFGTARVEGEAPLTETGAFVGSPEFIAPERVLGQQAGPASDLFSLGVLLYAAVEGWSPFRRSTIPATLQAVVSAEPQEPLRSGDLAPLITQLLRKDPSARPTAEQAARMLRRVASAEGPPHTGDIVESPHEGPGPVARALQRLGGLRTRLGLGAGLLAATAAVAALLVLLSLGPLVPDGWKHYDEDARVRASLAVPGDYERSADEDAVTFHDPGRVFYVELRRLVGIDKSPLEEANDWLAYYRDKPFESGMQDVRGAVQEAEIEGRDAAELTWTYRNYHGDDQETVHRRKSFVYINADNVEWMLTVGMPAKGAHTAKGDQIYQYVVESLKIHDL